MDYSRELIEQIALRLGIPIPSHGSTQYQEWFWAVVQVWCSMAVRAPDETWDLVNKAKELGHDRG